MIKIFLNGNEIIKFKGYMDLRKNQEVDILGETYVIDKIESTELYTRVDVKKQQVSYITGGSITADKINPSKAKINTINPFNV